MRSGRQAAAVVTPSVDDPAGTLRAFPGAPLPTLVSTRREWAPSLVVGQSAQALPALLGGLYALCGGAHRLTARHAVAAARGLAEPVSAQDAEALRVDTLREHLRRMWLDWPRVAAVPGESPDVAALAAGCPLLHDAQALEASRAWIESQVLGLPAREWLQRWDAAPQAFAREWTAAGRSWPARWLRAVREPAQAFVVRPQPLALHASALELQHVARLLAQDEGFALRPHWRGRAAETGPWTRCADRVALRDPCLYASAWMRLVSRVVDVARLVDVDGDHWLAQGALGTGEHEGLAWCEMARGLLMHWVRLQPGTGDGAPDRIAACHVLAPTEWNFHPSGVVARLLSALRADVPPARVQLLAAAFDPCVDLRVEAAPAVAGEGACTR